MPRTENEDWLLYQTFDDGTQDSGFKAFRAGLDIMEKRFTSTNTGRIEMPPACGNCPIGVRKCEAIYGKDSCHSTLWRHFVRT